MWKNVKYDDNHLNEIIDMTKEYYGDIEISDIEFIKHEYFKNPVGNALIRLAWDKENNTLAGQYVVNPTIVRINGQDIPAVLSLNTLTRAKYRGQGIFTGLAETVYDDAYQSGYKFCYGMPNQNSYPGFIKKLDFLNIGDVPLMIRPLKPSSIMKEKTGSKILEVLAGCGNLFFKPGVSDKKEVKIVKIDNENIQLIDKLWDRIKDKYQVCIKRDSKFVQWRYLNMPLREYIVFIAVDSRNEPFAMAVGLITTVAGMTCGMIVDFIFGDGYEDEAKHLLDFMVHALYKKGAGLCGCLMNKNSMEFKILCKKGFFVCPKKMEPQPFKIIFRAFDSSLNEAGANDFSKWFFTMGDYDVI